MRFEQLDNPVMARLKERIAKRKAWLRQYSKLPAVKAKQKKFRQTPKAKATRKKYELRPEHRGYARNWIKAYRQKKNEVNHAM